MTSTPFPACGRDIAEREKLFPEQWLPPPAFHREQTGGSTKLLSPALHGCVQHHTGTARAGTGGMQRMKTLVLG